MQINLKLFAAYQETLGEAERTLTLSAGTTAGQVLDLLITEQPKLAQWREVTRFGVNLQFAAPDTELQDGDELVLIPPVSGG